jgi:sulfhydrogenase subunit beta (sulfur reductase)
MIVSTKDFELFLNKVNSGFNGFSEVIVPRKVSSHQSKTAVLRFEKLKKKNEISLNSFRTIDPLKILFYLAREKVYPVDEVGKKRVIVGVKACDLKALLLLDKAMLEGGFTDPAYYNWRKSTLIISSDCDEICETCHCNLVGGKSYSEKGFDINISRVNSHYALTTGSEQGKAFLELIKKEIQVKDDSTADADTISEKRNRVLNLLKEQNQNNIRLNDYSEFRKVETKVWKEESEECVGCGACTNICPTCYCLILNDESINEQFVKVRGYDSCQWFGYARVAGGGSPRHKMTERFRNRYLCKFDYMNHNFGEIGCTGCGRCTEACTGQIDFRKVVKNISKAVLQKS